MTFAFFSWNLETSTWLKFFFFLGIKSQERYWYSESTMDNVKNVDKSSYNGGALLRMGLNDNKAGMQGLDKEKINKIIMEASKVGLIIFIFPCQQIYAHLPFPNRWSWWDWIFLMFSLEFLCPFLFVLFLMWFLGGVASSMQFSAKDPQKRPQLYKALEY